MVCCVCGEDTKVCRVVGIYFKAGKGIAKYTLNFLFLFVTTNSSLKDSFISKGDHVLHQNSKHATP